MDGWQFRLEQKKDPSLAEIPIVALSADGSPKAATIDADAYIKKPVPLERLVATVERVVVARRHRELGTRMALADRLTALGTLAAGMAHEINNPLSYVLLNVAFVADSIDKVLDPELFAHAPEEQRMRLVAARSMLNSAAERARAGVERIAGIVRGMKMFSQPEDDSRGPVDVRVVIDSTLPMLVREIEGRARLVKDYGDVPLVDANEARLGQVFLNLVLNAAQSLDGDPGNVIRLVVRHHPPHVVVEVHDTGSGIADDVRARIFEPFFTTKPVGVGTGLGLSICHGIVRSFGGEIAFESKEGLGTVFRVSLPAWPQAK
jgi:signal transduction histidine kinase